jgi:hypothetical protein
MPSTSETGHAKNVANYEKLIADVTALGVTYNPSKANLKPTALNTQLTAAKAAIATVNTAESLFKNAAGARDAGFAPLSNLVTRMNNALKASDTTPQIKESAKTLVRLLQGRRATPKPTEEAKIAAAADGKTIVTISSSRMSFDMRLDTLDKLIKLLTTVPAYAPNEADLKVSALTTLYNDLKTKNSAAVTAETALKGARIARADVLYKPSTGLVATSVDVKTYLKSVYGGTSPQYKMASGLRFNEIH